MALLLEVLLPVVVLGVDWSFLPQWEAPPPIKVMTVEIRDPPLEPPPPPEEKPKPRKVQRTPPLIAIEVPKPLPGEKPSRIQLPEPVPEEKPEPKPKPKPEPEPMPEPEPEPAPEPEAQALPSVFQDAKPVKKARIKYPPEAEAQHIQGRVKVRLTVSPEGTVTEVEVLVAEPPGVFEEAVQEGVRQYLFKKDGTRYKADQEVVFKIDE